MSGRSLAMVLIPTCILLVGANPVEPEDGLRQAQSAFLSQDYERAIDLYRQLEKSTTDPGFVAYNKGLALYRLALTQRGDPLTQRATLERAAQAFACCENDPSTRCARAAFGWANCLVQLSDPASEELQAEIDRIQLAIKQYRRTIQLSTDVRLKTNAQQNLAIAKLRRIQLLERQRREPPKDQKDKNRPNNSEDKTQEGMEDRTDTGDDPGSETAGNPKAGDQSQASRRQPGQESKHRSHGKGKARPRDEDENASKLSIEEALKKIREATERIRKERRVSRARQFNADAKTLKDW